LAFTALRFGYFAFEKQLSVLLHCWPCACLTVAIRHTALPLRAFDLKRESPVLGGELAGGVWLRCTLGFLIHGGNDAHASSSFSSFGGSPTQRGSDREAGFHFCRGNDTADDARWEAASSSGLLRAVRLMADDALVVVLCGCCSTMSSSCVCTARSKHAVMASSRTRRRHTISPAPSSFVEILEAGSPPPVIILVGGCGLFVSSARCCWRWEVAVLVAVVIVKIRKSESSSSLSLGSICQIKCFQLLRIVLYCLDALR